MGRIRLLAVLAVALALGFIGAFGSQAAGGSLRVCADPDNMPFSNEKGEGFENKLA
ncbi:MAG: quinoprotein dehydrogenase-associated putative ABC transporter substrate-binding protein, partial [Methyloceanibacter sp.]|nr:quinoprotein dehydrogenase-associated putative ABC transporter substrate-binding protein [Methyloceanibacter sp.]